MKPASTVSLASTIEALQHDDAAAFHTLYLRLEPRLHAFALRLVRQPDQAEELVQEAFLKLWEHRHDLRADQNPEGYLFRIARNAAYNRARHRAYEFAFARYLAAAGEQAACLTQEAVDYQDLARLLEEACQALPPVRRQVFVMSRVEGKSNSEIASLLNTSNSNIENHLHKALKAVRERFKACDLAYSLLITAACALLC